VPAVTPTGTSATRLIVLRGNSGSGKSTVARAVRERYGRGCALIEQDYLRRIVLREREIVGREARQGRPHIAGVLLAAIMAAPSGGGEPV
jgi:adenylylsulfate kinase-like enzyme